VVGAAGVEDRHYRCVKLASDAYLWMPQGSGWPLRDVLANRPAVADWHGRFFLMDQQASNLGDKVQICGQLADASWDFMTMMTLP